MKKCHGPCSLEKPYDVFTKDKHRKHGLSLMCKDCQRLDRQKHKEKITIRDKHYRETHKKEISEYYKSYKEIHKEEIRIKSKQYIKEHLPERKARDEKNKDKINARRRERRKGNDGDAIRSKRRRHEKLRRKNDICYRLRYLLRARIKTALKKNYKKGSAINNLGCSVDRLRVWLEDQFYRHPITGEYMTWENLGSGWQIDHIMPLALFDIRDKNQLSVAGLYTNLQPLWKEDHYIKTIKDVKLINTMY